MRLATVFAPLWLTACSLSAEATTQQPVSQDHLTYLLTSSDGLLTPFRLSNISELDRTLRSTPCTLFYTYASWSAHARHFIFNAQSIQHAARKYQAEIAQGSLNVAVVEMNEPLEEGHNVWTLINDGAYWGSMAILSKFGQTPVFVNAYEWDDIVASVTKCLEMAGAGSETRGESKDGAVHGEL